MDPPPQQGSGVAFPWTPNANGAYEISEETLKYVDKLIVYVQTQYAICGVRP